jgi:hypothetical protein
MTEKRIPRPRDPLALAKLIGDIAKASPEPADRPLHTFSEWDSLADTKAYADL